MSGKIQLKVRKGKSLDSRYNYYPEAYLEITGECGTTINISPSYPDIMRMIESFRKHEIKVDLTRDRKRYDSKLIMSLNELLMRLKVKQLDNNDEIEQIYYEQRKK